MRRNNLRIWRNIGKIVILLFQITYYQIVFILKRVKRISSIHSLEKNNDRTKRSNTKTKDDITFI